MSRGRDGGSRGERVVVGREESEEMLGMMVRA